MTLVTCDAVWEQAAQGGGCQNQPARASALEPPRSHACGRRSCLVGVGRDDDTGLAGAEVGTKLVGLA